MRLFIGIAPDKAARQALHESALRLQQTVPGRYADPSLYHITLAFLGELDARQVPAIRMAMGQAAADIRPFVVALGDVGTFGPILWRGVADSAALCHLSDRVRASLRAAGIPYDQRPFTAHITLARDARLSAQAGESCPAAAFPVRSILLYESVRHGGRLTYHPLAEVSLQ